MQRRSLRTCQQLAFLSVCAVALLGAACKRDSAPLPGAATEPAATVRQLAQYLHDNDLPGYARASVTPAQYAALETAWAQGHSRWPLTDLPLDEKLPDLLGALSEPGAEQKLQRAFRAQFEGQAASVRQAAHSLGLFGVQYITHQGDYTPAERDHYVQLVNVLSGWAQSAPLSDAKLARTNIGTLTTAARATGLGSAQAFQDAGMSGSLQRLVPFAAALKQVLASCSSRLPLKPSAACRVTPGAPVRRSANSSGSSCDASEGSTPTCTVPVGTPADSRAMVSSRPTWSSAARTSGSMRRPNSDSAMPRPVRSNSRSPHSASRAATCRLISDSARSVAAPARASEPCSATCTKDCSCLRFMPSL